MYPRVTRHENDNGLKEDKTQVVFYEHNTYEHNGLNDHGTTIRRAKIAGNTWAIKTV